MIVAAAFLPHTPLLIPGVNTQAHSDVKLMHDAISDIAKIIAQKEIDTFVFISAHSSAHDEAFTANLSLQYKIDLSSFGDHTSYRTFEPDTGLVSEIQHHMRVKGIPFTLESKEELDHGTGVPLLLLDPKPTARIVSVGYSHLSPKDHVVFGRELKDVLMHAPQRIALVASGDLSHCLSTNAPLGYKKEGELFDKQVQEAVTDASLSRLLRLPPEVIREAGECAYRPLLTLFGALERMQMTVKHVQYQAPYGVGYLCAYFDVSV